MAKTKAVAKAQTAAERIATFRPPTERERTAIDAAKARNAIRPARVAVKTEAKVDGASGAWPVHSDGEGFGEHMRDTLGTASNDFCDAAITRLGFVLAARDGSGVPSDKVTNAALAIMGAIAPGNEMEAIIGEQIVATHALSMELMGRASRADMIPKAEAYVTMATKLSRTMAAHLETLGKLRSGGKQQVEVRYVYVDARGGQNIIASQLQSGGGGGAGNPGQPRVAGLPFAPGAEVWGADQSGDRVPAASDEGQEALPASRRQKSRRAQGEG